VALTGSSGKTSTKDLLAQVLEHAGPTVATEASFNNELGVPLTICRADAATRFLVLEMGARGPGHIAYLCRLAPPSVAVVLNVGAAHAGEFGGKEATARAKRELVEALPADGVAVLNADDPLVAAMASRTAAHVVRTGRCSGVDVRADDVRLDDRGRACFRLSTRAGSAEVALQVVGDHQVDNALAAAAVGLECGLDVAQVAAALSAAEPRSRWRMEVAERPDGLLVVNDAYNANPDSVAAALRALASLGAGRDGRTWAVLGEMRELGAGAEREHAAVGALAAELGVDRVVAVGEGAAAVATGATRARTWDVAPVLVADAAEALRLLAAEVRPGDVVLVKASRAAALESVATALLEGVRA
jgi:UDP-N-acetylmuramoyl-tripeptide--D-alanyl-D-alanine ligase